MSGEVIGAEFCRRNLESMRGLVNLRGTFFHAMCVLNITFAIVAALGDILMTFSLWKASSIPKIVNKIFLNMALSDHAVRIFPQLMYGIIIAIMLNMAADEENNFDILCSSGMLTVCSFSLFLLACLSFLTDGTIAVDRFLGIFLHLRYKELVTPKRVCLVLVFLWFLSFGTAFLYISLSSLMRRSSRNFNIPPPPGKPRAFELLKIGLFKFPPPWAKMVFKCPTLSSDLFVKSAPPKEQSSSAPVVTI